MAFAGKPPNPLQRLTQHVSASRLGSWLLAYSLHHADRLLLGLSAGRLSLPGLLTGLPVLRLTTIGAKSGLPRTVPLVGLPDGNKIILVASNFGQSKHPAWYYNLRAHPTATLVLPSHSGSYLAHEATPAERAIYWPRVTSLYRGYAAYQQRTGGRVIPLMVLTPQ